VNKVLPFILSLRERVLFQTFDLQLRQEICKCDRSTEGKMLLAVICKLCLALKKIDHQGCKSILTFKTIAF